MKITIPKPCHENWDKMKIEEKGRFCAACSTKVTDFTLASDEEIIDAFSNSSENVCGNFNEGQLNRDLQYSYINSLFTKFAVGFILTAGGIISVKAQHCEIKNDTIKQRNFKGKPYVAPANVKKDTVNKNRIILGGIRSEKLNTAKPLFVLDGKIIKEEELRALNPNVIGSMNVLKGASATSVYGEKGKNGVIVIKSKSKRKE